jgi:hypothetical protein
MYEFLFEPCILKCYEFLFEAWFFLMYFKIPYNFTICFYDPSLFGIFRAVSKSWF